MDSVKIQYRSPAGRRFADKNGHQHVIRFSDLAANSPIWILFDPASLPAQQQNVTEARLQRLNYTIDPFKIELYLYDTGVTQ